MKCQHCGSSSPGDARFCQNCGGSVVPAAPRCGGCGTENVETAKYCVACGKLLTAAVPAGSHAADPQGPASIVPRNRWNQIIAVGIWSIGFVLFFYLVDHVPSSAQASACALRVGSAEAYKCYLPEFSAYLSSAIAVCAFAGFNFWSASRKR